jgi:hypothetical protein
VLSADSTVFTLPVRPCTQHAVGDLPSSPLHRLAVRRAQTISGGGPVVDRCVRHITGPHDHDRDVTPRRPLHPCDERSAGVGCVTPTPTTARTHMEMHRRLADLQHQPQPISSLP